MRCPTTFKSTYYYEAKEEVNKEDELTAAILEIFQKSGQNYGIRKINMNLRSLGILAPRQKIGRIMKKNIKENMLISMQRVVLLGFYDAKYPASEMVYHLFVK